MLHILLLEDSEDDAVFVTQQLRRGGYELVCHRVDTEPGFKKALSAEKWDLIIADYNLPGFNALVALRHLQQSGMDLPFIVVSGAIGEEVAVGAMKSGAHDYILKSSLARLVPAVERELRDVQVRRQRKLAEEDLRTSREQLRALAAHLQSVREEERKRITREIHDELGQSLTGFKMDLAWIRNRVQSGEDVRLRQTLLDKIGEMGTLLDGTADLVRKLCTELRPGVLDDLGLSAAIEWQAREYQNRTGIRCEVRLEPEELIVDPERSTALFRILQEILTNAARHAHATEVVVAMKTTGTNILLEVKDNGRGITEVEKIGAKSLGLLGMRERAFILGGEMNIQGAPGEGTTVSVLMPLSQFKPESATFKEDADRANAAIPCGNEDLKHKRKPVK
ncbi:MAG TPA: ATP-binding protein [Verrucomicrobiae bacterium]|nr:ATP-binding protein [Verrucomicrobiae bacterium]